MGKEVINMANAEIVSINFNTAQEAKERYLALPEGLKFDMAEIYRAAFGGKPWYEKYTCSGTKECGFLKEPFCPTCKNTGFIKEAYPVDWLIETYFEEMVSAFIPGILGLIQLEEKTEGFTTGGFTPLNCLIDKKYGKKSERVSNSITKELAIPLDSLVFYDNETCIAPSKQGRGLGPKLSQYRIEEAIRLRAEVVCGRTINLPWLKTKEEQFKAKGFDFKYFVPDGDTYSVDGNPRYFYIAKVK